MAYLVWGVLAPANESYLILARNGVHIVSRDLENGDLLVEGEFATTGVVEDQFGNKWTLPADDMGEDMTFLSQNPLAHKKDPRFHYEFVRSSDVPTYQHSEAQFKLVNREEAGFGSMQKANRVEGGPDVVFGPNEAYKVGGGQGEPLYLMKTPVEWSKRIEVAKKAAADSAVESCLSQSESEEAKRIREAGLGYEIERNSLVGLKVVEKKEKPYRTMPQGEPSTDPYTGVVTPAASSGGRVL